MIKHRPQANQVLKIRPAFYHDIMERGKRFEVRTTHDRQFKVGDTIKLREFNDSEFTGREVDIRITYILSDPAYCKEGTCIFSFDLLENI